MGNCPVKPHRPNEAYYPPNEAYSKLGLLITFHDFVAQIKANLYSDTKTA